MHHRNSFLFLIWDTVFKTSKERVKSTGKHTGDRNNTMDSSVGSPASKSKGMEMSSTSGLKIKSKEVTSQKPPKRFKAKSNVIGFEETAPATGDGTKSSKPKSPKAAVAPM